MFSLCIATQSTTRFILLDINKLHPQTIFSPGAGTDATSDGGVSRCRPLRFHSYQLYTIHSKHQPSTASNSFIIQNQQLYSTTMSNIDELFDRGDRHREEIEELWRTTTTTEQRQGTQIQHITSRLNAVSDQVSLQASAKEKTTEASEASNRRIHDLEETVKKGKGSALELDVHVKETARRFRGLTDQCNQQRQQIESLQALVSTLTTRLEAQEAIPTRRCTSCDKAIKPAKQTHVKCEECYLRKRSRTCTICSLNFLPVHFSYKVCPPCYITKKAKKPKRRHCKTINLNF